MQRLINIQNKLKAPKNQKNTFGGYNYRSAEDILEAVKPLLTEEKCALLLNDEVILVGNGDQARFYIKATATLFDNDGKQIATTTAFARESLSKKGQDDSQITGTASSYARKYALNGLFCIDDNKDADTDEYHKQTEPKKDVAFYKKQINEATEPKDVDRLFFDWSRVYVKGTAEYLELGSASMTRKKQLGWTPNK